MTKVSIGLPVFNGEQYVQQAIEAIRAQTHQDLEILISDNNSTDGTRNICEKYAEVDNRIRYVRQDQNIGAQRNFEFVLNNATSEFFAWAAVDDLRESTFIEALLRAIHAKSDVVGAMSDVVVVNEVSKIERLERLETIREEGSAVQNRSAFFIVPNTNVFFCIYGLFRRHALLQVKFNDAGKYLDGTELPILAQVACAGRIVSIPEPLFKYCIQDKSSYQVERAGTSRWRARYNYHVRRPGFLLYAAWRSQLPFAEKISCMWLTLSSATRSVFAAAGRRFLMPRRRA